MSEAARMLLSPEPLLFVPVAGIVPVDVDEANRLLVAWGHDLGECNRPFRSEGWALVVDGRPVSVAVSASIVSDHVVDEAGRSWERGEVVELARQASAPEARWATRAMLRLWREVAAPRWDCWPVKAAVSYAHNRHAGDIYRFDGWTLWQRRCGASGGGGAWTRRRYSSDAAAGPKALWGWRYEVAS